MNVTLDSTPLHVRTNDIPVTRTRKAFIRAFLRFKSPPTYSDLMCRYLQCEPGRKRSVTELYQIVLSRFPKTSFENLIKIIAELIDEDGCFYLTYCTQINKVVVLYKSQATQTYLSPHGVDNHLQKKGLDGFSLEDYSKMINKIKTN